MIEHTGRWHPEIELERKTIVLFGNGCTAAQIGCKRRIFDPGYLESLPTENQTLTNEKALEIVSGGVRTEKGLIEADLIILANGITDTNPNEFAAGIDNVGRRGETIPSHWKSFGGPEGQAQCRTRDAAAGISQLGLIDEEKTAARFAYCSGQVARSRGLGNK
ncbi:monooxygenase [Colletotrichum orchidophilum]|uniref:Monooxygenase n=1 Tax=Colletotrichum orchidophilum TaxID=1209926 RepID=A0A1G4B930_9PEZI|nr:monooxygenase [Colletotrichum orchidophilum]OHE97853.1 monooxygenase [Colletotrichum orchidophilum]